MPETENSVEHLDDDNINCNSCTWNSSQTIGKGTRTIANQRKNQNYLDYSVVEINENTGQSPEERRRIPVAQTLVKTHRR